MSASRSRFQPCLETLEDRTVPATVTFSLGVVTITGTPGEDDVYFGDEGNVPGAQFGVVCDNQLKLLTRGTLVKRVVIATGGGDDHVRYEFDGSLRGAGPSIVVTLGEGDDTFFGTFVGTFNRSALRVNVASGPGRDVIVALLAGTLSSASLGISIDGGQDSDTISLINRSKISRGSVQSTTLNGGQGRDQITANCSGQTQSQSQSQSQGQVVILGGAQVDVISTRGRVPFRIFQ